MEESCHPCGTAGRTFCIGRCLCHRCQSCRIRVRDAVMYAWVMSQVWRQRWAHAVHFQISPSLVNSPIVFEFVKHFYVDDACRDAYVHVTYMYVHTHIWHMYVSRNDLWHIHMCVSWVMHLYLVIYICTYTCMCHSICIVIYTRIPDETHIHIHNDHHT